MNLLFKNIFLRLIGIILILFYAYLRFFQERMPTTLFLFFRETGYLKINYNLLIFLIFLLTIACFGLYFNIKYILKTPIKIPQNKVTNIIICFYKFIKHALISVNEMIANNIPQSYDKMKYIVLAFYNNFGHQEKLLFICFVAFPYISIALAFICDVFILFEFKYFYKMLFLIVIPLLYNLWLFMIYDLKNNLYNIEESLIINHKFLVNGKDHFTFKVKPGYTAEQANFILTKDVPEYLSLYPLKGFLESYYEIENQYKQYVLLFFYSTYFFGCLYIFINNLILFNSI